MSGHSDSLSAVEAGPVNPAESPQTHRRLAPWAQNFHQLAALHSPSPRAPTTVAPQGPTPQANSTGSIPASEQHFIR